MGYMDRFEAAFDELHGAVVRQAKTPAQYIRPHHDYPKMSMLDSGFPTFHETGFYQESGPRDYVGTIRPRGLLGLLGSQQLPKVDLPKGAELATFLRTHDIGKRLNLKGEFDWTVDRLVGDAVERYLQLYGLDYPIESHRRNAVLMPLMFGTVWQRLDLRLVVPITLTHFEADHFSLSTNTYITRIPKKLQLARARMTTMGTGAVQMVVGAATHAFVSTGWNLDVDNIDEVYRSLSHSSLNVVDAIDTFFGALRVATGISTGYAQFLWVPRKWAVNYFCDLTPVYGTALRQYPSDYDDYGWTRQGPVVTKEQLNETRRIYSRLIASNSEAMRLAVRRLNVCLTRSDAADAILDGTIGLELLLGDDQNQSLSYKLRLRAGALALLHADPSYPAGEVTGKVKRLYAARSAIVHGRRKKSSKTASGYTDTSHTKDRAIASDLLRFVLDVLLAYPQYLDPTKIDEGLLLRGDAVGPPQSPQSRRRPQKQKR